VAFFVSSASVPKRLAVYYNDISGARMHTNLICDQLENFVMECLLGNVG